MVAVKSSAAATMVATPATKAALRAQRGTSARTGEVNHASPAPIASSQARVPSE